MFATEFVILSRQTGLLHIPILTALIACNAITCVMYKVEGCHDRLEITFIFSGLFQTQLGNKNCDCQ